MVGLGQDSEQRPHLVGLGSRRTRPAKSSSSASWFATRSEARAVARSSRMTSATGWQPVHTPHTGPCSVWIRLSLWPSPLTVTGVSAAKDH